MMVYRHWLTEIIKAGRWHPELDGCDGHVVPDGRTKYHVDKEAPSKKLATWGATVRGLNGTNKADDVEERETRSHDW